MRYQRNPQLSFPINDKLLKSSIAGWIAGVCNVAIAMPFDTCKVRIQTSNSGSFLTTMQRIIKTEKLMSLWKGGTFPFLVNGMCVSYVFTVYSKLKDLCLQKNITITKYGMESYLSGGLAGAAGALIYCPVEHVRIRMQTQQLHNAYRNSFDCLSQLLKRHGFKALYRGCGITLMRDFVWMGNYFFTFEKLRQHNTTKNKLLTFVSGGLAGIAGWTGGFMLDNIKSKIQTDVIDTPRFKSARQVFSEFSLRQLSRGYLVGIYRGVVVSATTLGVFQIVSDKLEDLN